MDRGTWQATVPGVEKVSDTTKLLSTHTHTHTHKYMGETFSQCVSNQHVPFKYLTILFVNINLFVYICQLYFNKVAESQQ